MDFDFRFSKDSGAAPDVPAAAFDAEQIMLAALNESAPVSDTAPSASASNGPDVAPSSGRVEDVTPKRRGRPRKRDKQQEQVAAAMSNFFSPEGIGALWVSGWNGFFNLCGAEILPEEQQAFHATVFGNWAKHRLPQTPEKYQPDMMLLASVAMMTLPRMAPIAKKTAPVWSRVGGWLRERAKRVAGALKRN